MKIEEMNNKIIVYLYNINLSFENINKLNKEIKDLFIRLIKKYQFDLFGYYIVDIYHNKKYGSVLELNKMYENTFVVDIIDLKVIVHKENSFYLEMNDNYIDNKNIFIYQDKYYLKIDDLDNINKYIEYGKIKYNNIESIK